MTEKVRQHREALRRAVRTRGGSRYESGRNWMLIQGDARAFLPRLPDNVVACTVTSPPYAALKNYGAPGQLGFGQDITREYLPDVERVLQELFRVTRCGGALWLVLDTLKEAREASLLPWEFITRARKAGWIFHDLIVWDKGRSLPWSNAGRFRAVFEHIVLLGKGPLSEFNLAAVREVEHLSPYWVRYPERYHPSGKAPTNLWHFPIPVQGSWNNGQSRHFCPFPVGLVGRMIAVTTRPGDIVLDPFAGTGTVLAVATHLKRFAVGIEINRKFVSEFARFGRSSLAARARAELSDRHDNSSLHTILVKLRMLKYPKTLFTELERGDRLNGNARDSIGVFLIASARRAHSGAASHKGVSAPLGDMTLFLLARPGADTNRLATAIAQRVGVPPLSKFGIRATVAIVPYERWSRVGFAARLSRRGAWCVYRLGRFYRYHERVAARALHTVLLSECNNTRRKVPTIISRLKVHVTVPADD